MREVNEIQSHGKPWFLFYFRSEMPGSECRARGERAGDGLDLEQGSPSWQGRPGCVRHARRPPVLGKPALDRER